MSLLRSFLLTFSLLSVQTSALAHSLALQDFCKEWSKKLRTVDYQPCLDLDLKVSEQKSVLSRPLVYREFLPANGHQDKLPKGKILFISGIHGDEYTAVSIGYQWMQLLKHHADYSQHHWLFLPLANPDGLLHYKPATRTNANGVDLNRNFPSSDWQQDALQFWRTHYNNNPRRFPGSEAASEPETQWMLYMIERFQPDAIISIHAPYGLLDYDGPEYALPDNIGALKFKSLGTFPGSLGRYAWEDLKIPVMTIELGSAGRMPSNKEMLKMWQDIENWSQGKIKQRQLKDF